MSDTFLRIIPTTPSYVPNENYQRNAVTFLTQLFPGNQIEQEISETIQFIDQGANFESVACNLCGQQLEIEKWQDVMDNAFQNNFDDLKFTTPCCNQITSLNDLDYRMPAGFAKYFLSISNPQRELSRDEISNLKTILDTDIKIVWAHY